MAKSRAKPKAKKQSPKKAKPPVRPKVTRIVDFVRWLEKSGHTEEFLSRPGVKKAYLTLDGSSLTVLKKFVDEKKTSSRVTAATAKSFGEDDPCPDGFECFK